MKTISLWLLSMFLAGTLLPAAAQVRGGRYDAEIRARVAELLKAKSEYKNVTAKIEDSVVELTGSVELDSTRRALISRVRGIPHVERAESNIVLAPPAVADEALYGRVERALAAAGFGEVKIRVHEGAVRLEGTVRNAKERQRAILVVRQTDGVKEVQAVALTVAE
jgi:osmotically-inducible protein OsmY